MRSFQTKHFFKIIFQIPLFKGYTLEFTFFGLTVIGPDLDLKYSVLTYHIMLASFFTGS